MAAKKYRNNQGFEVDFIGIGAAKSATTWITRCLDEHPEIGVAFRKEVNYFNEKYAFFNLPPNWHKGVSWYKANFLNCKGMKYKGEFSVEYLMDPSASENIYQILPQVKLIVSLRNPIDATYSLYHQLAKENQVPSSFRAALEVCPSLLAANKHGTNLRRYFRVFPKSNIHPIVYERIRGHEREVISALYHFLGADSDFVPQSLIDKVNPAGTPKSEFARRTIHLLNRWIITILTHSPNMLSVNYHLRRLKVIKAYQRLTTSNLRQTRYAPMDAKVRQALAEYFQEEVRICEELLHTDLWEWKCS